MSENTLKLRRYSERLSMKKCGYKNENLYTLKRSPYRLKVVLTKIVNCGSQLLNIFILC